MNECVSIFCKAHTTHNHIFCGKCEKKGKEKVIDEWINEAKKQKEIKNDFYYERTM